MSAADAGDAADGCSPASAGIPPVENPLSSLTAGIIVCAYTQKRWDELASGVSELTAQLETGDQVIVVIDHNDALLARALAELAPQGSNVLSSQGAPGLSSARNTGIDACGNDLVLFLDDDAFPQPEWITAYRERFAESPDVVAVGGAVEPNWEGGSAPQWFPPEFGWVVGCDYTGMPKSGESIRNPIGASMAIRRTSFDVVGRFRSQIGRVGELPVGCEETELSIRLSQALPGSRILRDTRPVVKHLVPKSRQRVSYFWRRCYHEGRSKEAVAALVGTQSGLSSERSYVVKTLVRGVGIHLLAAVRGDFWGVTRAAMLPVGLTATVLGYMAGKIQRLRLERLHARADRRGGRPTGTGTS
ncbi:MAG: glycosyltransferase [Candidatus Nanopelagicales bacterium]|nr:glycosyltransferase [Candidatus Nanopelagicales bacterium]MDZ4250837.1 glycosyltransferase [Candidatus Nanopelagicales bacterium]